MVNGAPIQFVFALDAYEELIQIHEEGMANRFFVFFFVQVVGCRQENEPSSVCAPAGERKPLPSKHCWQ